MRQSSIHSSEIRRGVGGWETLFFCSSVPERIDFWCAQIPATAAATNTQVLCQNRAPTEYSVDSSVTLADRSNEHGQCVQRSRDKKSSRARNTQVWAVTEFPIQGHESDRFCKCFIWVLAWPPKIFRATVSWKNTFFRKFHSVPSDKLSKRAVMEVEKRPLSFLQFENFKKTFVYFPFHHWLSFYCTTFVSSGPFPTNISKGWVTSGIG